jgi:hydroxyacylglutathione hydrolase
MEQLVNWIDLGFVNAYLLKAEDGFILVDTGIGDHWKKLESELLTLGCLPERLKLVVLTHGDLDHAGNCKKLQEKYGIKIAMHQDDLEMVSSGKLRPRDSRTLSGKIIPWIAPILTSPFECFEPDLFLQEGDRLDPYGLPATILHIPGHTLGSIALLTDSGDLIVGDTLLNKLAVETATLFEDKLQLHQSLLKLKKCTAHTIYPGHGKPFPFEKFPPLDEN